MFSTVGLGLLSASVLRGSQDLLMKYMLGEGVQGRAVSVLTCWEFLSLPGVGDFLVSEATY